MKRRQFLKIGATGLLSLGFGRFNFPVYASNNNILILVELKGGNDGLNTVIPFTDENYYKLRPNLSINSDSVLRLSDNLGLNPIMNNLIKLWQEKELAIILGVGYPEPNRSHFRSIEIWETASNSQEFLYDGWISRVFSQSKKIRKEIDGIILGQSDEGSLSGINMNNLIMSSPEQFLKDSKNFKSRMTKTDNPSLEHVLKVEGEIFKSSNIIEKKLKSKKYNNSNFPKTNIGKQFNTASDIIIDNIPVSVIKIEHGSFDTHINQRATQDKLLNELSDAIYSFRESMKENGYWNNIIVMTYSEFGRRVSENGSNGTDHGTSAPHFVMGGKVRGGFYGKQPHLDDLTQGDLKHFIDYRSIYSSIVKNWWNTSVDFLVKYPTIDFI